MRDPDQIAAAVLRGDRLVSCRRGSRSDRTSCKPSKWLSSRLAKLRASMDPVFRCDTAFGTCRDDRPSAGHCMLASMVVQDLFGGRILASTVSGIPHYWNLIPQDGRHLEVDLTGDQFPNRPAVQASCDPLYPGQEAIVFQREPHEGLVPELNQELTRLHRRFVKRLSPALSQAEQKALAKLEGRGKGKGSAIRRSGPPIESADWIFMDEVDGEPMFWGGEDGWLARLSHGAQIFTSEEILLRGEPSTSSRTARFVLHRDAVAVEEAFLDELHRRWVPS